MPTNLHKHIPLGQKPTPNNKNTKKMQDLKNAFLKEYKNNKCNISAACKKLRIARGTFYDWQQSDENFKLAVNEAAMKDYPHSLNLAYDWLVDKNGKPYAYNEHLADSIGIYLAGSLK